MKLEKYYKALTELIEKRPETLQMEVVHASDDEGNAFQPVYFHPSVGNYDKENLEFNTQGVSNAVCIN